MMMDTFGIELEAVSSYMAHEMADFLEISHEDNAYDPYKQWILKPEYQKETKTVCRMEKFGIELISPQFVVFPEDSLGEYIDQLSANDCYVNKTCGLHFHFSGPSFSDWFNRKDVYVKFKALRLLQLANPHPQRVKFCRDFKSFHDKTCAIRHISEDHWECRVFNAELNLKYIIQKFETMRRVLYDSK